MSKVTVRVYFKDGSTLRPVPEELPQSVTMDRNGRWCKVRLTQAEEDGTPVYVEVLGLRDAVLAHCRRCKGDDEPVKHCKEVGCLLWPHRMPCSSGGICLDPEGKSITRKNPLNRKPGDDRPWRCPKCRWDNPLGQTTCGRCGSRPE